MPFWRRLFILGSLFVSFIGLLSAAPVRAESGICCTYKMKSGDGVVSGDPHYKVNFSAKKESCPSYEPADQWYLGTLITNSKVCADQKLRTFQEATYETEFDAFWAEITGAGGKAIADGVAAGAKAITDTAGAAVDGINALGSQLNHGRLLVNWYQLESLNKLGTDVPTIIGKLIKGVMGVIGSIAFALFIYAGILWMISSGNTERIQTSRSIMVWTSLGILVIFSSYALVNIIFEAFK